jgi:pimeloyl-ACP methyl ester carboxylesterase
MTQPGTTHYVTSADGTRIAFDREGEGPPLILVSGLLCSRTTTAALASELASQFTVINYDRRGRGESGDTPPYAVGREVEDLAALMAAAGGAAAVYGHSSGAGLAVHAAASGLPVTRLVLHEPPYSSDDEASRQGARDLATQVEAVLAQGHRREAVALFFRASGLPAALVAELGEDPGRIAAADTMVYDFAVMGEIVQGGAIPEDLVQRITIPTLVLAGGASPDFFRETAERVAALLPQGQYVVLQAQDHGAPADIVAPVVARFVTGGRRSPDRHHTLPAHTVAGDGEPLGS